MNAMNKFFAWNLGIGYYLLGLTTLQYDNAFFNIFFFPVRAYKSIVEVTHMTACGTSFPANISCAIIVSIVLVIAGFFAFAWTFGKLWGEKRVQNA